MMDLRAERMQLDYFSSVGNAIDCKLGGWDMNPTQGKYTCQQREKSLLLGLAAFSATRLVDGEPATHVPSSHL